VPTTPPELDQLVRGLVARLAETLAAEPFDPSTGYWVGSDLVAGGFAAPEALGRSITMLQAHLLPQLGRTDEATAARLTALIETLAAGFAAAVHDRALDAQEAVRIAALTARNNAEQALRRSEARFRHFATHDLLTRLPNRTLLIERLTELVDAAGPDARLGLCCVDLDGLTAVNDSLGLLVGDKLLIEAARRLRLLTGAAGYLVARMDSDQFAILLEGTTCGEDATKVADRVLATIAEPIHVDDSELPLTASAGVVEGPVAGTDPAELIRSAQIALNWAKADGRARWKLFNEGRSQADVARYRLSAAMPAALRRGEFTLAYQPLIELRTGRLVGVEALARWLHPERGLLGADQFIGLATDSGMIVPLGNHLLEQACRQAAAWRRISPAAPYVSVNLAARQLHQAGLVGFVAELLDRVGLPAARLQLEITEHAVIGTDRKVIATMSALARLGVRIAIDDFGTGYSNLACLRGRLPLHGLKLDGTFAQGPAPAIRPSDAEFLATVVSIGRTLGLTVTAEGIETAAHARRMRAAGCEIGQGWHLGRPMRAERITALIS
jgi:diguanylate cyclase (GGDEF)-like protein